MVTLRTHVSSIARVLGRVGDFCGPLVTRAERFSSLVFGTAIFLVWRLHRSSRSSDLHSCVDPEDKSGRFLMFGSF